MSPLQLDSHSATAITAEPDAELVSSCLRDAAALVRRGWCQGAVARDAEGNAVAVDDSSAAAWCAWGAILRVADARGEDAGVRLLLANDAAGIVEDGVGTSITAFNDVHSVSGDAVARALERAAESDG